MKILGQEGLNFIATKFKELRDSLSSYAKKEDLNTKISKSQMSSQFTIANDDKVLTTQGSYNLYNQLFNVTESKVDKKDGKQLSSNDYTNEAKAKVDAIPEDPKYTDTVQDLSGYAKKSDLGNKADKTEIKTKLSELTDDATHRLVTDTEKTTWNNKLDTVSGKDVSRAKTKGYDSATIWSDVSSNRDVEDWIGDFDKRTRKNKKNMEMFTQTTGEISDLKYSTLKRLTPGFYKAGVPKLTTDSGVLENYENSGYLLLSPEVYGSLFIGFDFLTAGFWVCLKSNEEGKVAWIPIIDCRAFFNINEKLKKIKQQVILTQAEYDKLTSSQKNDATKIYFIKE